MSDNHDDSSHLKEGLGLTLTEVASSIVRIMQVQMQRARNKRVSMNCPIEGDSNARSLLLSLLPLRLQRSVFLRVMQKYTDFERARTLFGAPPYRFLNECDGHFINAGGISARRVNMSHNNAPSLSIGPHQFGGAQYQDEQGRGYRVCQELQAPQDDSLPNVVLSTATNGVLLYVKYSTPLLPPRVGEIVTLRPKSVLTLLREPETPAPQLSTISTVDACVMRHVYTQTGRHGGKTGVITIVVSILRRTQ